MSSKILTILIVVLALAAVGLGYAIVKQQRGDKSNFLFERRFSQDRSVESSLDMSVEEREKLVLEAPGQDASQEEKERHFQIAQSIAEVAQYLDITNCKKGNPVVFQVKEGQEFTVKNDDSVSHTVSLGEKQNFPVPEKSTKTILPEFDKGPGVYGYGCDGSAKEVGMILVVQ